VILFARNFASPEQIAALTSAIRSLRTPELLIAVDHEGGRVQRFRDGYARIPAMATLGALWDADQTTAVQCSEAVGLVIALELAASGIDFSFTPVLDLNYGRPGAIGDRAFHRDPDVVSALAAGVIRGLNRGGMPAVGKHFPGHGYVSVDSHVDLPNDSRTFEEIRSADLQPFLKLAGNVAAMMPAHIVYPAVDEVPAGFSRRWLQDVLRGEIGFEGVIFSDDLSMEAAALAGDVVGRAEAALSAGCDMVLVCNRPDAADRLLARLKWAPGPRVHERFAAMRARKRLDDLQTVHGDPTYQAAMSVLGVQGASLLASSGGTHG
jgi:beta-N-acetylhexosaminidase